MKKILLILAVFAVFSAKAQQLKSPNGNFAMAFSVQADGSPQYSLTYKGKTVIKPSKLGLELKDDKTSLLNGFKLMGSKNSSFDETWTPV